MEIARRLVSVSMCVKCCEIAWDPDANEVVLTDGRHLPADFNAWTYGHALTAHRAQGSTAEESLPRV